MYERDWTRRYLTVALSFTAILSVGSAVLAAGAARPPQGALSFDSQRSADVDPRWLPWLGCWALISDAVDGRQVDSSGRRMVCVTPRADGRGVGVTTHMDGVVALKETVLADGQRRPLQRNGCDGSQRYRWSEDGHRLLVQDELTCPPGQPHSSSGMSFLIPGEIWLDVQAVHAGDSRQRELIVHRYRRASNQQAMTLGIAPLPRDQANAAATARAAAAGPLEIDDIIDASDWVASEVLEAGILESESSFALDLQTLRRLADSNLDERLIDLMVAVSFPDDFVVENDDIEPVEVRNVLSYPYGSYPSVAAPYPAYFVYDPFFAPFGFGPRIHSTLVVPRVSVSKTGSLFGGKVIKGRGYARVRAIENNGGEGGFLRKLARGAGGTSEGSGKASSKESAGDDGRAPGGDKGGAVSSKGHTKGSNSGRKAKPRGGSSRDPGSTKSELSADEDASALG